MRVLQLGNPVHPIGVPFQQITSIEVMENRLVVRTSDGREILRTCDSNDKAVEWFDAIVERLEAMDEYHE